MYLIHLPTYALTNTFVCMPLFIGSENDIAGARTMSLNIKETQNIE